MRHTILFGVAFAIAMPLAAGWWPKWNPSEVQLVVGETTTVQVHPMWSGIANYGENINWTFRSDAPFVATAFCLVTDTHVHDMRITAIAPGSASIRQETSNGLDEVAWVRINVVCAPEAPVRASAPMLRGSIGEPVAIEAVSEIAERTTFSWYLGREGDRSHPLDSIGQRIAFTPHAYGSQYLWVSAITRCSESTTEFRIDVAPPRRRAVSR
jgi:hypothetical protein